MKRLWRFVLFAGVVCIAGIVGWRVYIEQELAQFQKDADVFDPRAYVEQHRIGLKDGKGYTLEAAFDFDRRYRIGSGEGRISIEQAQAFEDKYLKPAGVQPHLGTYGTTDRDVFNDIQARAKNGKIDKEDQAVVSAMIDPTSFSAWLDYAGHGNDVPRTRKLAMIVDYMKTQPSK